MESARRLGNCLTFSLALWWATRGHGWIGFRRSEGLHGLIPHFVHGRTRRRGTTLLIVEAIPERRKSRWRDPGDFFVLFPMMIRATRWRRTAIGTGDTLRDAIRDMRRHDICRHCGRMP